MLKVGEILKNARTQQKLSLEEISENTRIKPIAIEALENGDYSKLPEKAYIEGFVKNYSIFLGLDPHNMIAIFRREYDAQQEKKIIPENLYKKRKTLSQRYKFTNLSIFIILGVLFILFFLIFSFREAIFSPSLNIVSPPNNAIIKSYTLTVIGHTGSDMEVNVNNQQAIVNDNGDFAKTITILPGQTQIEIDAINKYGKKTIKIVNIKPEF